MDFWDSGVPFSGIYGPSGGSGSTVASDPVSAVQGKSTFFGLEVPTLIALGVVTWWVIKKLD